MSESDGEQVARSVALEQAYVHEVYEQCAEKTSQSKHWPRIYEFLEELEPGALVCDIGCGNGKYLSVNRSIFKVGADRCKRFTKIAREKENEVLVCDNLALPFRDDSFDAVLSIAVVHHFATTERRVHALKELARVLRIGGRLVISVWAMEQKHRKFESQDVLVPWPKAYCVDALWDGPKSQVMPNDRRRDQTALKHSSKSHRRCRSKSYWIDPIFSPSPSTSSLSSPNETCYSFFRRALQKLAGGKRSSGNRPWFLETWQNGSEKRRKRYEVDDSADLDELPIELRRLEEDSTTLPKQSDSLSIKSKSVGDIFEIQRLDDLVRSRSSIPGLCSTLNSENNLEEQSKSLPLVASKPRLVKQKTHLVDDTLEIPEITANEETTEDFPNAREPTGEQRSKRGSVAKQVSMNEELMSTERLEEKERLRRNIMKQASLNEEIICKGTTFDAFRDSTYYENATKRFQLLKSGLTNKIRQSTTNIEKVSSISINGFVRILQSWKSSEAEEEPAGNRSGFAGFDVPMKNGERVQSTNLLNSVKRDGVETVERRSSREDGSDSSKDSSLQSDTSVDSEDSIASVIFVPKPDVRSLMDVMTKPSGLQLLSTTSAPPSPRVKHPPDASSRLKLITMSPLLSQYPATSKSLPPPSPPGLSPRTLNSVSSRPFFAISNFNNLQSSPEKAASKSTELPLASRVHDPLQNPRQNSLKDRILENKRPPSLGAAGSYPSMTETINAEVEGDDVNNSDETARLITDDDDDNEEKDAKSTVVTVAEEKLKDEAREEETRRASLKQIKELLKQKTGFATRTKPSFPLMRRASMATDGRLESVTRVVLPKLLSLELFNPETDDLDSDTSPVSSPESVGSVISVISDERYILKRESAKAEESRVDSTEKTGKSSSDPGLSSDHGSEKTEEHKSATTMSNLNTGSPQSPRLLQAAASVGGSWEDGVQPKSTGNSDPSGATEPNERAKTTTTTTITPASASKTRTNSLADSDTRQQNTNNGGSNDYLTPVETTWNEECRQHLIDFTEKLSKNHQNNITEPKFHSEKIEHCELAESLQSGKKFDACKYSDLSDTIAWLNKSNYENSSIEESDMQRSSSDDIMDFVMISGNAEFENESESREKSTTKPTYVRCGNSIESSDIGDSIENTISLSDGSQTGSIATTGKLCSGSTVSLLSNTAEYSSNTLEKRKLQIQKRSASEEIHTRIPEKQSTECLVTAAASNDTLMMSGSSSQESLPSDRGGGAITYHQYYHVFKEGELDQLINKYVENLHIISSYYDHASWCIVAEKVQVWTI
ncbi:uncharacterized protein fid [Prorops nasuta]|uniref:uncharacterized protein fid n=1 Tax=Prorops nasuta TaxID=863751 RepID=UPI0034CF28DA